MLSEPNPDSAVNEEAANLFNTDKKKFDAIVFTNLPANESLPA